MPKVHFVKSARKTIKDHNIAKGESYYWRKFFRGGKCISKTRPKPSQLTRSSFWSTFFAIQESNIETPALEDCESDIESIISDLKSLVEETQSSLDNMPSQLQDAETGQMMQERIEAVESIISELEGIDYDFEDNLNDEEKTEKAEEIWIEVTSALDGISCE